jgi:hypothetical protein
MFLMSIFSLQVGTHKSLFFFKIRLLCFVAVCVIVSGDKGCGIHSPRPFVCTAHTQRDTQRSHLGEKLHVNPPVIVGVGGKCTKTDTIAFPKRASQTQFLLLWRDTTLQHPHTHSQAQGRYIHIHATHSHWSLSTAKIHTETQTNTPKPLIPLARIWSLFSRSGGYFVFACFIFCVFPSRKRDTFHIHSQPSPGKAERRGRRR